MLINLLSLVLLNYNEPIVANLLILLLSIPAPLASSLVSRILIAKFFGIDRYKQIMREIREFDREYMKALREKDNVKLEKMSKRKPYIDKMRANTFKVSMINTVILFPPFLFFYFWLLSVFDSMNVAYFPLLGTTFYIQTYFWYIICSFMVSLLINRLIGILYQY
jgi:Predicted membrane protein